MNYRNFGRCVATVFFILAGLVWTWLYGKDLNSDFKAYHLYSGWALLQGGRLDLDYFPASLSSYLNAVAELPVYGLVMSGWNDLLVAALLMLMHLPVLIVIWKITELLLKRGDGETGFACFIATLLAFLSPIQLTTLSDVFTDPVAGIFTLIGVYFLLRQVGEKSCRSLVWAGLFFGVGAGLKLTNLMFAVPAAFLALFLGINIKRRVQGAFVFSLGTLLGFALVNGWWAWKLWQKFGNPIFPFYNGIFHSPDFIAENFSDKRMLHNDWWTFLTLPYEMMKTGSVIYSENSVPDIRLLAVVVIATLALLFVPIRRKFSKLRFLSAMHEVSSRRNSRLWILLVYIILSYVLWGVLSGIGRYAYVVWLLLGPLMVALALRCLPAPVARIALVLVVALQSVMVFFNGTPAWAPYKWGGSWLDVEVPAALQDAPASYLVYGVQPNSFLMPFMHPKSRYANIIGQYVQPAGEGMTPKLREFLAHPRGPLRLIFETPVPDNARAVNSGKGKDINLDARIQTDLDRILSGYGYRVKSLDCSVIRVYGEPVPRELDGTWRWRWSERHSTPRKRLDQLIWVCDLEHLTPNEWSAGLAEYKKLDVVFDEVEDKCGNVLSPHRIQTVLGGPYGYRNYFNTITVLTVENDEVLIRPNLSALHFDLGKFSTWHETHDGFKCPDIAYIKRTTTFNLRPATDDKVPSGAR